MRRLNLKMCNLASAISVREPFAPETEHGCELIVLNGLHNIWIALDIEAANVRFPWSYT